MFLDNLSTSILKLCDTRRLSYEAASERCDLSSRYFGDIARGKTAPTILTLEKLCVGFALTPNDFMSMLGEIEDTFDIEVDETEVVKIRTVGEAVDYIQSLAD